MGDNSSTGQIDFMHWLIRLIAYVIDSIIIFIPTAIIYFVILAAVILSSSFVFVTFGVWLLLPLILGILELLYFVILDVAWGATIGKRILGLQVQMVNGGKVTYDKAFIRNISKIFWLFLVLDWLIGIVTTGDKRQKFTDRYAGTVVVQVKQAFQTTSASPPPPPPPSTPPT
ncbi:MAG: RDD family protein [Candidatus Bathyarchaeia archaeon]|jgi:uncharacterized RDD family membrane protein YckC